MALPMLINGADCGPVNPLQGLAKRFDQDRGIQQDQFGVGRSGPSRETFRTAQSTNPALEQEAARFFAGNDGQGTLASPGPVPNAFDFSLLHQSLPPSQAVTPPVHTPSPVGQMQTPQQQQQRLTSSWATDFLQQTRGASTASLGKARAEPGPQSEGVANMPMVAMSLGPSGLGMQWAPPAMGMIHGPQQFAPQGFSSSQLVQPAAAALWEQEFKSREESLMSQQLSQKAQVENPAQTRQHADDLAYTAAMLIDSVKDEQNPKFKNSQFLKLMRELRDGEVVVEGDEMVERSQAKGLNGVDIKGKGKGKEREFSPQTTFQTAVPFTVDPSNSLGPQFSRRKSVHFDQSHDQQNAQDELTQHDEDANEAYFRLDNEEYIDYWNGVRLNSRENETGQMHEGDEWGQMQDSWDSFEATTWGVKPVANYQFQPHNPYLMGDGSLRTRNHMAHTESLGSLYESVLELEAAVQRDPTSARAWFDLGVKQQENEREPKAIVALKRALGIDPAHLPAWLALAISHTNENDRTGADDAIMQWVRRNDRYSDLVGAFFERTEKLNGGTLDSLTHTRRHAELVDCLMMMARSGSMSGEVDADVQIALAVLLNTSDEYKKAQDCFSAALAVRPDDWQLYNRVGATLANSGSAEEALQYYYRALELNPAYIRARFNLGISCINMKRYEEAAQHILDALVLQDSDGSVHGPNDKRGITSSTLWDSLKTTCLHLQRIDLATLCDSKDLDGFRREFHV